MKRFLKLASSALLAGVLGACAAGPPVMEFSTGDAAAIRETVATAEAIANEAVPSWQEYVDHYYAEDAWVHMDGALDARGRPAILELLSQFTGIRNFRMEPEQVEGAGNLAYVYGRGSFEQPGEGGALVKERFRYLEVWRRQADGTWKVIQDIANHDVSAPAAPAQ